MNKILSILIYILVISSTLVAEEQLVSSPWAEIPKKIYIQVGSLTSAWLDRYTTYYEMVPAGDGTFYAKTVLYTGNLYNYIFFATTNNVTYYDAVPSNGADKACIVSTSPSSLVNIKPEFLTWYGSIGGDARRVLFIPPDLHGGTTIYVYSNWASTPTPPTNFCARPGNQKVFLRWDAPYGWWGQSGESFKAADVIYGGYYEILRSSMGPEGDYVRIATCPGNVFSYIDEDVENGRMYYYTIIAHDAYLSEIHLSSQKSYITQAMPNVPVNIRFRVEGIDIEKVKKRNNIVYLTPTNATDKYSISNKIPARFTYCYVRKKFLGLF